MEPIFQPFVPDCPICEEAAAEGVRPFVRHDNCTCGKRKPHCTADYCY